MGLGFPSKWTVRVVPVVRVIPGSPYDDREYDLPPKSARLVLRIYPVVGAMAKWETPSAFSKQTKSASFP
jgi:hypothetical protein